MNKAQIIAALTAAGVQFDSNDTLANLKALHDQHFGGVVTGTQVKENAPEILTMLVEVTDVQEIESKGLHIISAVDAMGKEESFPIQASYWKAIKASTWVKPGVILSVKAEKRIAGKTTYTDENGDLAQHSKDGLSVSRLNIGSKGNFQSTQADAAAARAMEFKLNLQQAFIGALQQAKDAGVDQMALASLLKG